MLFILDSHIINVPHLVFWWLDGDIPPLGEPGQIFMPWVCEVDMSEAWQQLKLGTGRNWKSWQQSSAH